MKAIINTSCIVYHATVFRMLILTESLKGFSREIVYLRTLHIFFRLLVQLYLNWLWWLLLSAAFSYDLFSQIAEDKFRYYLEYNWMSRNRFVCSNWKLKTCNFERNIFLKFRLNIYRVMDYEVISYALFFSFKSYTTCGTLNLYGSTWNRTTF